MFLPSFSRVEYNHSLLSINNHRQWNNSIVFKVLLVDAFTFSDLTPLWFAEHLLRARKYA